MSICSCGSEKCNKMCPIGVGERIIRFLSDNFTAQSYLGEKLVENGREYYVNRCDGYADGSSCKRFSLKPLDYKRNVNIKSLFDFSLDEAVNAYKDAYDKAVETVKLGRSTDFQLDLPKDSFYNWELFKSGRLQLLPLKNGDKVMFPMKVENHKGRSSNTSVVAEINRVFWGVDNETKEEYIGAIVKTPDKRSIELNIVGFPNTVKACIGDSLKPNGYKKSDIVSLNTYGFYAPIVIRFGERAYIIDSYNLYVYTGKDEIDPSKVEIVASWDTKKNELEIDKKDLRKFGLSLKSKELSTLDAIISYIKPYRQLIMPYGCIESNVLVES